MTPGCTNIPVLILPSFPHLHKHLVVYVSIVELCVSLFAYLMKFFCIHLCAFMLLSMLPLAHDTQQRSCIKHRVSYYLIIFVGQLLAAKDLQL